jgi:hypothetical protein
VGDRAALLARVRDDRHDPRAAVLLEEAPPGLVVPAAAAGDARAGDGRGGEDRGGGRADEPVPARETAPGRWEIDAPAGGGIIVVAESWDPDWKATGPGGRALPVVRADGLFAAFAAPPEGGAVTLEHAPGSVRAGAAVSAAALLALAALAAAARGRRLPAAPDGGSVRAAAVWAPAAAAAAIAAGSVIAGVGDVRRDRADASLEAAAVRAWSDEALAARRAGAIEPAARLLRHAASVRPDHAATLHRLGLVERELGREAEAQAALERAAALDPALAVPRAPASPRPSAGD